MGDGEFMNNQYRGGDFLQRGIGQFANLRWGMARKRGWYFCINSMTIVLWTRFDMCNVSS